MDLESLKRFPEISQTVQNLRLLFLRFFIAVRKINYLSCFTVLYDIKLRRMCRMHLVIPLITQQNQLFSSEFYEFLSFVDICENIVMTFIGTTGESLYAGGGTRWYMDLITNHSKPCSIGQKHSHCLANYSNAVVIGYPGRKRPSKLLTIVHEGSLSP